MKKIDETIEKYLGEALGGPKLSPDKQVAVNLKWEMMELNKAYKRKAVEVGYWLSQVENVPNTIRRDFNNIHGMLDKLERNITKYADNYKGGETQ